MSKIWNKGHRIRASDKNYAPQGQSKNRLAE